jgi:PilZ domain
MILLRLWTSARANQFTTNEGNAQRATVLEPGYQEKKVALLKEASLESRMRHIRNSGRLNSRVAVAIEWIDEGRSLRAEGYTVDIGAKGCLAVVPQGFTVGQKLRIVNLTNQISCEATLIWRGHEGRAGWELGLELQEASPDFWGLDF